MKQQTIVQHFLVAAATSGLVLFGTVKLTPAHWVAVAVDHPQSDSERLARVLTPRSMPAETTLSFRAIRNVESPDWLQDMEIEVQNNFSQSIYFLSLHLSFPNLPGRQFEGVLSNQVVSLDYGRWQLMQPGEIAASSDLPIKPGEVYVFKIPESDREGFESALSEMGVSKSSIKNIEIRVYLLSFGDGTGYRMGKRFSNLPKSVSDLRARDRPAMALNSFGSSIAPPQTAFQLGVLGLQCPLNKHPNTHVSGRSERLWSEAES